MKRITVTLLFVSLSATLIAQVWIPVCEGVKLRDGSFGNPSVLSMACDSLNDKLFIAGNFDSLCSKFYTGGAKFNGIDWDTTWRITNAVGHVNLTEMLFYKGYLFFGYEDGSINNYDGSNPNATIRLGDANGAIYALEYYKGNLYAAGDFTKIKWYEESNVNKPQHTITANNIARFDGTNWYALGNGLTYEFNDSYIHALKVWNNELYAGGFFRDINGHCIARWDGTKWLDSLPGFWMTTHQYGESVEALEVYNGQLYVGGGFDRAGNNTAYMIARWDSTNKEWLPVGQGLSSYVLCLNEIDGRLWAGGYFGKE